MKINKMQIGNFGKLKDYELELKDGFQIVYGKNEDGKSTLMAFIKMMFYSKLAGGRDIDKNLRKKYQPWDGSMMNGAIEFEHGGISYRLQKDIGATPGADKVKLIKMSTGEIIPLGKTEEVGKRFFELDLAGFERSVFISQIGSFSASGNSDEVAEKLMSNLVLSGDENISQQLVMNHLNDAVEDMESKNRKKGIFIEAKNELDLLRNERANIQILAREQRENIEKYHHLEEKLKEQKDIQNLLKFNTDKNKIKQLTSLIENITKYTELEKSLEKENISYKNLKVFLNDCSSLMEESEKINGSLEKLKSSIESELKNKGKLIPISEDEHKHLIKLVGKEKALNGLLKRIDENYIYKITSFIESESTLDQGTLLVEQLQKFHEDYQKYEKEKNNKVKENDNISNSFEKDKIQWDYDKKLRKQQINFTSEKLSIQSQVKTPESSKGKNKIPLLILSIVVGIISIILGVVISPRAIIGVGISFIIGAIAIKSNKENTTTGKDTNHELVNNLETELDKLKNDNKKEENLIIDKTKDYESRIRNITNEINKIKELQHENLAEMATIKNRIEQTMDTLKNNIEEKMKEKSCLSIEEFENNYLEYASDFKNQKVIIDAQQEYLKKANGFLTKVNEYEITSSYEDAKILIQKLLEKVDQLEEEKVEALNIAKGMGYDTPSLEYLIEEKVKLEPSIKGLEEVGVTIYEVEELQQKEKDLAGENLNQQFLELHKKIKTPDRNLSQVQEEIKQKEKEVNEKENYLNCIKIASQVMQEASDEMRQSFGPELNKKTAGIFKSLTNGKYGNILVTKDYDISIQSGIHYREWRYLSNGTIDQAYLALRLAITELISDKNVILPLFLDDVMMQYDDERMDAALKFISDYAKEKGREFQLILFTCHQHIIDNSKPYNTEVISIS